MERKSLFYISPGAVEVRADPVPAPGSNQVLVRTRYSAISSGTEMLLFRGQFPDDIALDENIPSLTGPVEFPLKYGYAQVGEIVEVGAHVEDAWLGKHVFAFQPHTSHFVSETRGLQIIPDDLKLENALFFANMETAVGLVMDGNPKIGERVVVFGQGIVGILTTALLASYPLEDLVTFDHFELRRQASLEMGASRSYDPEKLSLGAHPNLESGDRMLHHADLVFELTGNPEVLNQAIGAAAYEGRVVIGSWYGKKQAQVDLGSWFHRGRLQLVSSQVSRIDSSLLGRWDKERRYKLTWKMLKMVKPNRLITHIIPISDAAQAFDIIDNKPGDSMQVIFEY